MLSLCYTCRSRSMNEVEYTHARACDSMSRAGPPFCIASARKYRMRHSHSSTMLSSVLTAQRGFGSTFARANSEAEHPCRAWHVVTACSSQAWQSSVRGFLARGRSQVTESRSKSLDEKCVCLSCNGDVHGRREHERANDAYRHRQAAEACSSWFVEFTDVQGTTSRNQDTGSSKPFFK